MNTSTVKLRLEDNLREFIERESSSKGLSMSEYIRQVIEAERARVNLAKARSQRSRGIFG